MPEALAGRRRNHGHPTECRHNPRARALDRVTPDLPVRAGASFLIDRRFRNAARLALALAPPGSGPVRWPIELL